MHLVTYVFCIKPQSLSSYRFRLNKSIFRRSIFKKEYCMLLYYQLFIHIHALSIIAFVIKYQFITY